MRNWESNQRNLLQLVLIVHIAITSGKLSKLTIINHNKTNINRNFKTQTIS